MASTRDTLLDVGDDHARGRPFLALEFGRGNIDAKLLRNGDHQLDGLHRIEHLRIVKRQVEIALDLIGLGDVFQDFNQADN